MRNLNLIGTAIVEWIIKAIFEKSYNYLDILLLWYVFIEKAWGMYDWQTYVGLVGGFMLNSFLTQIFSRRF